MRCVVFHLGGVSVLEAEHVPGVLDDGHLEAQTEPEEGNVVFAGVLNRRPNLAFGAAHPEPAGDDDPVHPLELAVVALAQFVGGHPVGRDVTADLEAGVFQRLVDRHVGVLEIVLADQRDVDLAVFLRGDDVAPLVRSLALRE